MNELERRVERLESTQLVRRPIAVIACRDGDEAAASYLASVPEEQRPKLVVIIRRFGEVTRDTH